MKSARACRAPPKRSTKLTTERSIRFIVFRLRATLLPPAAALGNDEFCPIIIHARLMSTIFFDHSVLLGPPCPTRRRRPLVAWHQAVWRGRNNLRDRVVHADLWTEC